MEIIKEILLLWLSVKRKIDAIIIYFKHINILKTGIILQLIKFSSNLYQ